MNATLLALGLSLVSPVPVNDCGTRAQLAWVMAGGGTELQTFDTEADAAYEDAWAACLAEPSGTFAEAMRQLRIAERELGCSDNGYLVNMSYDGEASYNAWWRAPKGDNAATWIAVCEPEPRPQAKQFKETCVREYDPRRNAWATHCEYEYDGRPVRKLFPDEVPPCKTEDSVGCYWDAKTMGNGKGRSFWVDLDGNVTYWDE